MILAKDSMSILKKVSMIILMEHDLEKAVAFYKKLGCTLKFHLKNQWAEFVLGDFKLGLCPTSSVEAHKKTGIVFEVENLSEVYKQLITREVEFLGEPVEKIHGIMVSFKDPSGNILDLYQPTPEKVQALIKKTCQKDKSSSACCADDDSCAQA
jgi:predicted enzyme related to lactoylglutathione lyase